MTDPRAPIFAFLRPYLKGNGWGDTELLEGMNMHLDRLGVPRAAEAPEEGGTNPRALGDGGAFFTAVRAAFGSLEQSQVEGFQRLLQAYGVARWPISWAAYALATGWWETNKTMQPVREAYWLSEEWRKKNLRYYPWYGRGDVQLTWEANYRKADTALGLNGALIADPDLAMNPEISARIMVWGMENGAFTGKKLGDYLNGDTNYKGARQIINGHDKDDEIAEIALSFERALRAGGWA